MTFTGENISAELTIFQAPSIYSWEVIGDKKREPSHIIVKANLEDDILDEMQLAMHLPHAASCSMSPSTVLSNQNV